MSQNKNSAVPFMIYLGAVLVAPAAYYVKTVWSERAKRKKIDAWVKQNIDAIHKVRDDQIAYIASAEFTVEGFVERFKQDQQFLNIVQSQPKY